MNLFFLSLMTLLIFLTGEIEAQTELTGFFDVIHSYDFTENENSGFQINQFEVDISHAYRGHLSLGTAIAYNAENENLDLAMAYLHYNIIEGETMHPHREEKLKHSGLIVGKFDVPFGLDYLAYASPNRPIVSQPVVIEKTIGAWNDIGINFHMVRDHLKFDLSIMNGFNEQINLGTNIRIQLTDVIQLGFSHASDFASINERNNWVNGAALIAEQKYWQVKSEYLWTKGLLDGAQDTLTTEKINQGLYIQVLSNLKEITRLPLFLTVRYGYWKSQMDRDLTGSDDQQNRFTLGIGYQFSENCSVRTEFLSNQIEDKERNLIATMQVVASF